jgi:gamma-glutamylcyclotransferase (GGCT)/AIG2-like uncharacterized protein YtfP
VRFLIGESRGIFTVPPSLGKSGRTTLNGRFAGLQSSLTMASPPRLRFAHGPGVRLSPLGRAFLPDRALLFADRHVLEVVERLGHVVEGVLVAAGSDPASGHPEVCQHLDTDALRSDGTALPVRTDVARAPAVDLDALRGAYVAHELDPRPLDDAAAGRPPRSLVSCVFVYGTLLRGEIRHAAILRGAPESVFPATCPGRLIDLGDYPGMLVDSDDARSTVHGELVRFRDATLAAAVARLDAIEGFGGFGADGSLYLRRVVRVALAGGAVHLAWTYVYAGDLRAGRPIPSGDWRTRRGQT